MCFFYGRDMIDFIVPCKKNSLSKPLLVWLNDVFDVIKILTINIGHFAQIPK